MIEKTYAIVCNDCRTILHKTGKCACGKTGLILDGRTYYLYIDDDDFDIIIAYLDNGKVVRVVQSIIKDLAVYIPISKEIINRMHPKEDKEEEND